MWQIKPESYGSPPDNKQEWQNRIPPKDVEPLGYDQSLMNATFEHPAI
jgi:hypothetical protein